MRPQLTQKSAHFLVAFGCAISLPSVALAQAAPTETAAPVLANPPAAVDPAYAGSPAPLPPAPMAPGMMPQPMVAPYRVDPMAPVRFEMRRRVGLAIVGGSVFGSIYLASTIVAAFFDDKSLAIPVVGPFIQMGTFASSPSASSYSPVQFALLMNGLAQSAGVAMLIAGLIAKEKVALYRPNFCISPYTAQAGGGLVASGRF